MIAKRDRRFFRPAPGASMAQGRFSALDGLSASPRCILTPGKGLARREDELLRRNARTAAC
jgi:hypothetical protein